MTQALSIQALAPVSRALAGRRPCQPIHKAATKHQRVIATDEPYLMLTGATGFVGSMLLAELLKRGHRCMVLLRSPVAGRWRGLLETLQSRGIDGQSLAASDRLIWLSGSLPDHLPRSLPGVIGAVIHVAGSTRFSTDASGEPARTNDEGTRQLLAWMDRHAITTMHHVSTAYVSGAYRGEVPEAVFDSPPRFRNAYERSKWLGEQHVWRWGDCPGRSATIYRPSIVVGDWQTGYATRFSGPYRAFAVLDTLKQSQFSDRIQPLRIDAVPSADVNFIPVDYLVELMASIVEHPTSHDQIYNIVHPDPIPIRALFAMCGQIFGIPCTYFDDSRRVGALSQTWLTTGVRSGQDLVRRYPAASAGGFEPREKDIGSTSRCGYCTNLSGFAALGFGASQRSDGLCQWLWSRVQQYFRTHVQQHRHTQSARRCASGVACFV